MTTGREKYVKRKRKRKVDSEGELRKSLANVVAKPQMVGTSEATEDVCDHFATLIADQLRKLNGVNRLILQKSIQNKMLDERR